MLTEKSPPRKDDLVEVLEIKRMSTKKLVKKMGSTLKPPRPQSTMNVMTSMPSLKHKHKKTVSMISLTKKPTLKAAIQSLTPKR
jgi:hypothetical protein